MASKILNITTGKQYKYGRILRDIEQCSVEWVEKGVSVRSLNYQETTAARSANRKPTEHLAYRELHGLHLQPAESGTAAFRQEGHLAAEANRFAHQTYLVSVGRLCWLPGAWSEYQFVAEQAE